ncbi:MAG: vitamin B12 dependent-methionine synthase activation domain-containing protein, partial [Chloroflexota bacterium]
ITPSLDEMVHVAHEMQRQGFTIPLLIGGATTSPAHTSVRIEPEYRHGVIYVKDASRAVGVCQTLITPDAREAFFTRIRDEHATRRDQHASRRRRPEGLTLAEARARKAALDWKAYQPPIPGFLGARAIGPVPLQDLVPYIDWMPFFNAWEFPGKFPDILHDSVRGSAASALWEDARRMLDTLVRERWLTARAVLGFFPAAGNGDDIEVFGDAARTRAVATLHHLRQQKIKPAGQRQLCLADFIAPRESGLADHVGAFAVTAGIGIEEHVARFEAGHDDYSAILLKALADRLAEASAEYLHERVRREYWGYAPDERLSNEQLMREEYRGIRPAPGYPACPD